jgi:hypothetical protein
LRANFRDTTVGPYLTDPRLSGFENSRSKLFALLVHGDPNARVRLIVQGEGHCREAILGSLSRPSLRRRDNQLLLSQCAGAACLPCTLLTAEG